MKKITLTVAILFVTISFGQIEITNTSTDDTITDGVLCSATAPGDITAAYTFALGDFGVDPTTDFLISEVRFGASALVNAPAEGNLATVSVYTVDGPFPIGGTFTLIESQEFAMLPGTQGTLYEVPFNAEVPGDSNIVLQVSSPNDGTTIVGLGTNPVSDGAISYALGCGGLIPVLTDISTFGLDTFNFVIEATGSDPLSVNSNVLSNNISLFPNPTNGNLNLNLSRNFGDLDVNIVNVSGQVVMNSTIEGVGSSTLQTSKLANGVYFAQISSEEGNTTIKFIKN